MNSFSLLLFGIFGKIDQPINALGSFETGLVNFLTNIIRLIFVIAGLYALLNLIIAGFQFINAGGDAKTIESAWAKIWQSLIGLIIITCSFIIAAILGLILFGDATAILQPKIWGPQ